MAKRKARSLRARFEVFKRDKFACQYCGRTPPAVVLEVDHIIPLAGGGQDVEDNLLTACFECNRGKAARGLEQVPTGIDDQMQERRDRAAQFAAYNEFLLEVRESQNQAIQRLGVFWNDHFQPEKGKWMFGAQRATSVRTFLKHLPEVAIMEAIEIAVSRFQNNENRAWLYFCGVCWRTIKEAWGA